MYSYLSIEQNNNTYIIICVCVVQDQYVSVRYAKICYFTDRRSNTVEFSLISIEYFVLRISTHLKNDISGSVRL